METFWIVDFTLMADGKRMKPIVIGPPHGYPTMMSAQNFIDSGNGLSAKAEVYIAHSRDKTRATQEINLQIAKKLNSLQMGMTRKSHFTPEQFRQEAEQKRLVSQGGN